MIYSWALTFKACCDRFNSYLYHYVRMLKLANKTDLKSVGEILIGSSPITSTKYGAYSLIGKVLECTHKNLQWILVRVQLNAPYIGK